MKTSFSPIIIGNWGRSLQRQINPVEEWRDMYAQADKSKENKSRAVANNVAQKKISGMQGLKLVNNRSSYGKICQLMDFDKTGVTPPITGSDEVVKKDVNGDIIHIEYIKKNKAKNQDTLIWVSHGHDLKQPKQEDVSGIQEQRTAYLTAHGAQVHTNGKDDTVAKLTAAITESDNVKKNGIEMHDKPVAGYFGPHFIEFEKIKFDIIRPSLQEIIDKENVDIMIFIGAEKDGNMAEPKLSTKQLQDNFSKSYQKVVMHSCRSLG